MKKVLIIGLLLTAVIYALPVFCGLLEEDSPLPIPQDSIAVDAEITPQEQETTDTTQTV